MPNSSPVSAPTHPAQPFRRILGVRFFVGSLADLLSRTAHGGLIVTPSAPVLVRLDRDEACRVALERSDLALTDSAALVLLWFFTRGQRLRRISGLRFLRALLQLPAFRTPGNVLWVMPSRRDAAVNRRWLENHGVPTDARNIYVAPEYGRGYLKDTDLLDFIGERRPRFIVISIGGGVQERLGLYLRESLDYSPAIICTGAAIAFLSGRQVRIPVWADRLFLGWLFRCVSAPHRYVPRYLRSLRLVPLLLRFGSAPVRPRSA